MIMSTYYAFGPINFTVWLVFTAVAECALTGCMVWCAHVTSAVTTSLVGVLKGVVAVVLGFFLLGESLGSTPKMRMRVGVGGGYHGVQMVWPHGVCVSSMAEAAVRGFLARVLY